MLFQFQNLLAHLLLHKFIHHVVEPICGLTINCGSIAWSVYHHESNTTMYSTTANCQFQATHSDRVMSSAQMCMQHNYSIAQITVQFSSYLHGGDNSMELQIWARSHICGTKPVGFQLTRCLLCMMVSFTVDTCAWWHPCVFLNESKFIMTKLLCLAINVMKLEFRKSTDTYIWSSADSCSFYQIQVLNSQALYKHEGYIQDACRDLLRNKHPVSGMKPECEYNN